MRRPTLIAAGLLLFACAEPTPASVTGDAGSGDDASSTPTDAAAPRDAFRPDIGPDVWAPTDAGAIRTMPTFPEAHGTCPDLTTSGTVTFSPDGIAPRSARIWVGPAAATLDGPLVFVWHGAGGSPNDASYILGDATTDIVEAGGIVIAPSHDPANTGLPWFLDTTTQEDDLFVADEALACARASIGIDDMHVHSVGFSAGALHTTQMSFRRASYVASVVTYSGGLISRTAPDRDAPDARFAAMILFGGPDDVVIVRFEQTSQQYLAAMQRAGDFGFLCDHGMGHTVPTAARLSAWRFLQDHPYGMTPHAYEDGLPDGFYSYCSL
ncbi:MAG: hypothetical protein U0234_06625 [Sandaracinus sp.]